ncbi:glycoside hydrolase family 57 protein [Candidatus Margulisiibacteriota bacterium]
MQKGYLALVLHAHLPYIRHPEYESFLEENWFFEAITETYLPLLNVFENLLKDGIDFKLNLSVSPTLASMFQDELLQERYLNHLDKLIELTFKEMGRTRNKGAINQLAHMYNRKFVQAQQLFVEQYNKNLINGFRKFLELGKLDILTCGATHGFFPLMDINQKAVAAQVNVAVAHYWEVFGRAPKGIWLPECGYHPGHDKILKAAGIRYFIVDTHGVLFASPRPKYGIFAPIFCKSGVAAFGRDLESSKAVWSAKEGYPGDYGYRDFYRDIGFDLDHDYVRPYINADGTRTNTGIKYHRITGPTNHKKLYDPEMAEKRAAEHAGNFMFNRERQIEHLSGFLGNRKPIIVSPYDAELFGHWWYEGPRWLDYLIRKSAYDQKIFKLTRLSEYLEENPVNQVSTPSFSSWGYKGYTEFWLNGANDWIYRHLHKAADRMVELANLYNNPTDYERRILNQAARELLLAQSSDWAFIMKTGTVVPYAQKRFKEHIEHFTRLYEGLICNKIDHQLLASLERKNNIFKNINYMAYK